MGKPKATGGTTIDKESLQELLEEALCDVGHRVPEARCALKALKLLADHIDEGTSLTNGGDDPAEEISGAEVRDGLRFLLNLVKGHAHPR